MGEYRETLLGLIRLVLANHKVAAGELDSAVPDPSKLDSLEKAAWIALRFWNDDAQIRASDHRWARWGTDRLRHLIACLQTPYCHSPI